MNDKELDDLMVKVLWDSMEEPPQSSQPFYPSRRHRRQLASLSRDPVNWARRRSASIGRAFLRSASVVILVVGLSWGCLWLVTPEVHASIRQYLVQWSERHLTFLYSGDASEISLPQYELSYLPDGYTLTQRIENPLVSTILVYCDASGDQIHFVYAYMFESSTLTIDLMDDSVTPVTVNGCPGYYLDAPVSTDFDTLVWNDSTQNLQFMLSGCFDLDTMKKIAESIILKP